MPQQLTRKSSYCHRIKTNFPFPYLWGALFTGGQDKLKSRWKSEWQQQDRWWLGGVWGRRLGVYNYSRDCRRGGRGKAAGASVLSELGPPASPRPPREKLLLWTSRTEAGSPSEETLHGPADSTHTFSLLKCQPEIGIHHTHTHTHTRGCESPLQQALIKSCSWALLLLSPRDWCLASLAVTNTDWSQTLDDFGPNLFKDFCVRTKLACSWQVSRVRSSRCNSCTRRPGQL